VVRDAVNALNVLLKAQGANELSEHRIELDKTVLLRIVLLRIVPLRIVQFPIEQDKNDRLLIGHDRNALLAIDRDKNGQPLIDPHKIDPHKIDPHKIARHKIEHLRNEYLRKEHREVATVRLVTQNVVHATKSESPGLAIDQVAERSDLPTPRTLLRHRHRHGTPNDHPETSFPRQEAIVAIDQVAIDQVEVADHVANPSGRWRRKVNGIRAKSSLNETRMKKKLKVKFRSTLKTMMLQRQLRVVVAVVAEVAAAAERKPKLEKNYRSMTKQAHKLTDVTLLTRTTKMMTKSKMCEFTKSLLGSMRSHR